MTPLDTAEGSVGKAKVETWVIEAYLDYPIEVLDPLHAELGTFQRGGENDLRV